MAAFLDVCRFIPTAGGTTDWTFSSAVTGYQSPTLAGAVNGTKYKFRAESADLSQWELCEGAYNSGTGVFARTTVLYNSSGTGTATGQSGAGTKISFTSAPQVAIVALKEDLISVEEANSFSGTQQTQARNNINAAAAITVTTSSMGADVALSNTANYFDGPSVPNGVVGTWIVFGTVTVQDTAGAANIDVKLWDGTTVIASSRDSVSAANLVVSISLSGEITAPVGNLRISCRDNASTSGKILFNATGNSKDSTITAIRIA